MPLNIFFFFVISFGGALCMAKKVWESVETLVEKKDVRLFNEGLIYT